MRCQACDCPLSDEEATNKDPDSGEYMDMCEACLGIVDADLSGEDIEEEFFSDPSINIETELVDGQD